MTEQQPDPADQPDPSAESAETAESAEPPGSLEVRSAPFPRGESAEAVDQIRTDLLDQLRQQVQDAGWAEEETQVSMRVIDVVDPDEPDPEPQMQAFAMQAIRAPRPPHWQRVRSARGYRLRLVGANGERIVWSEHYTEPGTVADALDLVRASLQAPTVALTSAAAAETKSATGTGPFLVDVEETDDETDEPGEPGE